MEVNKQYDDIEERFDKDDGFYPRLSRSQRDDLERSGLNEETIAASCIYSAGRELLDLEFDIRSSNGGMVIPYLNVEDETYVRVKLNDLFQGGRYRSLKGRGNRLYVPQMVPRDVLSDPSKPLCITEGEKKALKGCQEGLSCVALSGVACWRTRNGDTSVPIPDFDRVEWSGRRVTIVFDSDTATNPQVAAAELGLARELKQNVLDFA